jgi:hypothetical protein
MVKQKPDTRGRKAISFAAFFPGTNRTSFEMFPIVRYNGHALCFPFPDNKVLSDVKMRGTTVTESASEG